MGEFKATGYVCERCNHKWVPRDQVKRPAVCPKCKSPHWDRERAIRAVKELRDREIDIRRSSRTDPTS
jgi:transcription initiation factor IIE alpha subunit